MAGEFSGQASTEDSMTFSKSPCEGTPMAGFESNTKWVPFVSVVIPCHNEEKYIGPCLGSILANDYPKERLEILVIDGMSSDSTERIVQSVIRSFPIVRLSKNRRRTIPAAMNLGVSQARGDIVLKIDAHSTYPRNYISDCLRSLLTYKADNAGGILRIRAGSDTLIAKGIAKVLSHPFGSGNAYVKTGCSEPRWTDTVAFGCYPRDVIERVGGWNENLAGSSDLDFNIRLRRVGGRILLIPDLQINYYADPDIKSFWRHNLADGVWVPYVTKFGSQAYACRHWIPFAFVLSLLGAAALAMVHSVFLYLLWAVGGSYLLLNLAACVHLAIREKDASYLLTAPFTFIVRHVGHGVGAIWGLLLLALPGSPWRGRRKARA